MIVLTFIGQTQEEIKMSNKIKVGIEFKEEMFENSRVILMGGLNGEEYKICSYGVVDHVYYESDGQAVIQLKKYVDLKEELRVGVKCTMDGYDNQTKMVYINSSDERCIYEQLLNN